jgi:hypothetical protein
VLDHALRQLVAGGVGDVLFQQPAQQVALLADREADRGDEHISERSMIMANVFSFCSLYAECAAGRHQEALDRWLLASR